MRVWHKEIGGAARSVRGMGRNNAGACYRELGAELRKRREGAGLVGEDIVRVTGWHRSKVSRVELGQSEICVVDAIHYLAACKVFVTEAKEILDLCRTPNANSATG